VIATDLFSDRGDGFSLLHHRRKGENAESRTVCPDYVSPRRSRAKSPVNGELQALSSTEKGEDEGDGHTSDSGTSRGRGKTPFSLSPPPRRSEFAFPRQYEFDDEMDAILEAQRLADERAPRPDPTGSPKRKREVLSDEEYRLRKERTDDLFEGYRSVRSSTALPPPKLLSKDEDQPGIEEAEGKGEQLNQEREADCKDKPVPLQGDSSRRSEDDDSDSGDDPKMMVVREALAGLSFGGGTCKQDKDVTTRIVLTVRQIRRVIAAKESLFKFGTFVPKSEREADASPEAPCWRAGRDLEWFRLREQGTFECDFLSCI
jgi:hypothetical protein